MMRILPALLLAACASADKARPTVEQPGRIVAEAELGVERAVEAASPPSAVLLELRAKGATPARLSNDLRAGRTWLRVERPRGFSFAGKALLGGVAPFEPLTASILFVQPRDGEAKVAEPALLRLGGRVDAAAIRSRIETVPPPGDEGGDELARIESADMRVLLGHGLDVLLACVGSGDLDSHHWIAVLDAEGKPTAAWLPALASAATERRLSDLDPFRVLVRRRSPGDPVPAHYRVRLADVVVAAQSRLRELEGVDIDAAAGVARTSAFEWVWEGVWSAHLVPPAAAGPAAWPADAPALEVRYKEYVRPSGDASGFWQGLFAPLALGADIGMAFLEGDQPLADSVAERQRARN